MRNNNGACCVQKQVNSRMSVICFMEAVGSSAFPQENTESLDVEESCLRNSLW